ncbi:MAG: LacI family transcriptional regulator [Spirochaetia bacterium]|nr:LacI family transcriptional regulator [Spirochaetia bacterium]
MRKDKNVTIYDIARESGVSPATVSRVLNGKVKVAEQKRLKVLKVMEDLDFHPNLMARNLPVQQSKTIGVILPDISNPFFSQYFVALERYALIKGYTMYLCNTMNNACKEHGDMESLYLSSLLERRVDGLVYLGGRINAKKIDPLHLAELNSVAQKIPMVLVNGRAKGVDTHIVRTKEREGFMEMVEYVVSQGHTEIALIGGIEGVITSDLKYRAFKDVMNKYSLAYNPKWLRPHGFSIESGERTFYSLLQSEKKPTAAICINDYVAMGVIRGALKRGFSLPHDLSVSGFDNIELSAHSYPSISTVSHRYDVLAEKSLDVLFSLIAGAPCPKETTIPMELVLRESIVAPSA